MKKIIKKYDDTEIKKYNFYQYKRPISIRNININKKQHLIMSPLVKRILNTFLAIKMLKIKLLCIYIPKMGAYRRDFDKLNVSFLIEDKKLLEKNGKKSPT